MRVWSCLFLLFFARVALGLEPGPAGLNVAELRRDLQTTLSQERFRGAEWGVKIVALKSGATLFETNAAKLLKPASTAKLFTGALALDVLGPAERIKTSLYAASKPAGGVLEGDLIVYGRGDPSFSSEFEPATNVLGRLVQAIRDAGIRRIEGDLVGDATFFNGPRFGTGWTWDDLQYYYGAEATALAIEDNSVELRIRGANQPGAPCEISGPRFAPPGFEVVNRTKTLAPKKSATIELARDLAGNRVLVSGGVPARYENWSEAVAVSDAPLWFALRLKQELERAGITVKGRARAVAPPENLPQDRRRWIELGTVASPPVASLTQRMMKISQNLYAQLLLLQAGARYDKGSEGLTTEELGIQRLRQFAARAGIRGEELQLDDGTGLSRSGLVSPNALVQLLLFMNAHSARDAFRAGLPEAGTDGTLRGRLKELKGRLWAKTGTIRYVNTLAGYLVTNAGEELAFAIMLNAHAGRDRDEVDGVARLAARLNETTSRD